MKVSIITATYNSEKTVADTIDSVLRQTYKDVELIIVDGASTDNTLAVVDRYKPVLGDRLKVISEKDEGLYYAMNKGIAAATGEVVGILNSDDFYTSSNILEEVVHKLSDPNIDAVYGDVHYVNEADLQKCVRYYSSSVFRRGLMLLGFMPAHPSFYCRQEVYKKYGRFDVSYKVAADFEQLLRLIYIHKIRAEYLPLDFVTMRTGGISNSNLNSRWTIMQDHRRALKSHHLLCSYFLLNLRYIYKIYEVLVSPIRFRKRNGGRV